MYGMPAGGRLRGQGGQGAADAAAGGFPGGELRAELTGGGEQAHEGDEGDADGAYEAEDATLR